MIEQYSTRMKGLIVSVIVFGLYKISTMAYSHVLKPKSHLRIFLRAAILWTPVYFAVYLLTPRSFYFLPESWTTEFLVLDVLYGYMVFLLNVHSYVDVFYGFVGGFSASVMLEILQADNGTLTAHEIIQRFRAEDGADKIYAYRLPRLADSGYITVNDADGTCALTPKGHRIAGLTKLLKRFLNLGSGG